MFARQAWKHVYICCETQYSQQVKQKRAKYQTQWGLLPCIRACLCCLIGSFHAKTTNIREPCTWHLLDFAGKLSKYALCYQMKESQVLGQYLKWFFCDSHLNFGCHAPFWHTGRVFLNFCHVWRPTTSVLIATEGWQSACYFTLGSTTQFKSQNQYLILYGCGVGHQNLNFSGPPKRFFNFMSASSTLINHNICCKEDDLLYLVTFLLPFMRWEE